MYARDALIHCVIAAVVALAPVVAGGAASANPFLYEVFISGKAGTDTDSDGFLDTFAFDVQIDANAGSQDSVAIAAIIWCTATDQAFLMEPWTITGNVADPVTRHFTERDFVVGEPLALRFRVELWTADFGAVLDVRDGLFGEPVLADGPGCSGAWIVAAGVSGVAAQNPDSDGCAESFSFNLSINADTGAGCTKNVTSEVVCLSTGQVWRTEPWTISGDERDAFSIAFTHDDFAVSTCTDLRFRVRLFDPAFTTQYDEAFIDRTVKADRPVCTNAIINEATIANVYNTNDSDGDGYLDRFDVDIRVDADAPGCSMPLTATVKCLTTGAELTSAPFIVDGTGPADAVVVSFNYGELNVTAPSSLTFTAQLWNAAHSAPITAAVSVTGSPVQAELGTLASALAISGRIQYEDRGGVLRPVRYAVVELCEQTSGTVEVRKARSTDGSGFYSGTFPIYRPLSVLVRVKTASWVAVGLSSPVTVKPPGGAEPYAIGAVRPNCIGSELHIDLVIGKTDPNAAAFHVFDSVTEGYIRACEWLGTPGFPDIQVSWPDATSYSFIDGFTMHVDQQDRWDRDVLMAVYGRYAGQRVGFDAAVAGDHLWSADLRTQPKPLPDQDAARLAFAEGWAAFFAVASQAPVTNDAAFDDTEDAALSCNLESGTSAAIFPGEFRVSSIACALWDLVDDNDDAADDADDLSLSIGAIANVLTADKPQTMESFWAAWIARNDCKVQTYRIFRRHLMSFLPAPCTIRLATNVPGAGFILTERDSQPIVGTAPAVYTNMPPGYYTITWTGPGTPPDYAEHSQAVEAGGSITFCGYFPVADAVPPAPNAFTAELAGPDSIAVTAAVAADDSPPVEYRVVGEFYDGTQWAALPGQAGLYDWSAVAPANWVISGLAENGLHRFKQWVRDSAPGVNTDGPSLCDPIAIPLRAPADSDLSVAALSPTSVVVSVTPPPKPSGTGQTAAFFQIVTGAGVGLGAVSRPWGDVYSATFDSLQPDTVYGWRVRYRGYGGFVTGYNPTEATIRTPANVPGQSTAARVSASGIQLRPGTASNPAATVFAVKCTASEPADDRFEQRWIDGCGRPSLEPHWMTADLWPGVVITGLRPETSYSFAAAARNGDGVETGLGPVLTLRTSVAGDVNSDCRVNILDLLAVRAVLNVDLCTSESAAHADLNGDGRVNILDLIFCRTNLNRQCQ